MALVTLLNINDPAFGFENAMATRNELGVMSPLTRFSVIPYFLDPIMPVMPTPADWWNLNHQQAHNDAMNALPYAYLSDIDLSFAVGANLVDTDLNDPEERSWWTFINHLEHFVSSNAILPNPQIPPTEGPIFVYPFW
jgi:hypothetical protein